MTYLLVNYATSILFRLFTSVSMRYYVYSINLHYKFEIKVQSNSISLLKMNMLTLIVVFTLVLFVYGEQKKDICPAPRTVLCVRDILLEIITATKRMKTIANKIDRQIVNTNISIRINSFFLLQFQRESIGYSLNRSAVHQEQRIRLHLPGDKYHQQYSKLANIDKVDSIIFNLIIYVSFL